MTPERMGYVVIVLCVAVIAAMPPERMDDVVMVLCVVGIVVLCCLLVAGVL